MAAVSLQPDSHVTENICSRLFKPHIKINLHQAGFLNTEMVQILELLRQNTWKQKTKTHTSSCSTRSRSSVDRGQGSPKNLRLGDGVIQRAPARYCWRSFRTLAARPSERLQASAGMQTIPSVERVTPAACHTFRQSHAPPRRCKLIQGPVERRRYQPPDICSAEPEESLAVQVLSPETAATAAR